MTENNQEVKQSKAEELISALKQLQEAYRERGKIWKRELELTQKLEQSEQKLEQSKKNIFKYMGELRSIVMPHLEPYIKAMLTASGITEFQAKTLVYYALGCYHLDEFEQYPIVTLFGISATGKSRAIDQLRKVLPYYRDMPTGATYSTLAEKLNNYRVIVVEEADKLKPPERCEEMLQDRTDKAKRFRVVSMPPKQDKRDIDNWGATILHKREGFDDIATRNRSITIFTHKKKPLDWHLVDVDKTHFKDIAEMVQPDSSYVFEHILLEERIDPRTLDVWRPVIRVAESCGDLDYLYACKEMLHKEAFKVIADDEPLEVTAQALIKAYYDENPEHQPDYTKDIRLSKVVKACVSDEGLMVKMSPQKMKANLRELEFHISFYEGNNYVKANPKLTKMLEDKLSDKE